MAITLVFLNSQVQELFQFSQPLYLSVRPLPLAAAALLAALTLAFSALNRLESRAGSRPWMPSKEKVRFNFSNDVKTGKLTGKIFGFPEFWPSKIVSETGDGIEQLYFPWRSA